MNDKNKKQDIITNVLLDKFRHFLQDNNLERMNRNIRKLFFDYLRQHHTGLAAEFDAILDDIED